MWRQHSHVGWIDLCKFSGCDGRQQGDQHELTNCHEHCDNNGNSERADGLSQVSTNIEQVDGLLRNCGKSIGTTVG